MTRLGCRYRKLQGWFRFGVIHSFPASKCGRGFISGFVWFIVHLGGGECYSPKMTRTQWLKFIKGCPVKIQIHMARVFDGSALCCLEDSRTEMLNWETKLPSFGSQA